MIVGYDCNPSSNTVCLAKGWQEKGVGCAILLYACGTPVDQDAVMDGIPYTLSKAAAVLQKKMEEIAESNGADDLIYAATTLAISCSGINRDIIDISDYLGQGIYIGGVIMYHTYSKYALLPFGGGTAYVYSGNILMQQGQQEEDSFIRNTLGSAAEWKYSFWQGDCMKGLHFLFTTKALPDINLAAQILKEHALDSSHPNTVSMLLKKELDNTHTYPSAVMEIHI